MSQEIQGRFRTFKAGAALAIFRRVRLSAGVLAYAGAADADGLGVTNNPTFAANDLVAVTLVSAQGTLKMTASGVISLAASVYAAASGKIAASGTIRLGIALEAAGADGDIIEVLPSQEAIGSLTRANLATDAAAVCNIPLRDMRVNATGAILGNSAGTPTSALGLTMGTHGSAAPILVGEAASGNSKTDVCRFAFALPVEYVAGEAVTLRIRARADGTIATAKTVAAAAYKSDGGGGVGSSLIATGAQTVSTSFANYDFVVTPTTLSPGDLLDILLTTVADDTGGTNGKLIQIGAVQLLCDVKG